MNARSGGRTDLSLPVGWTSLDPLPPSTDADLPRVVRLRIENEFGTPGWLYTVTGEVAGPVRRRLRSEQPELDRSLRAMAGEAGGALLLPWLEYGDPKAPRPYLISARPGPTLFDDLRSGPLSTDRVVAVARTVIEALLVLHRHHRVHGLIAPQSLHRDRSAPDAAVRITAPLPRALAELVAVAGGTGHESPEVLRGGEPAPAADVFALASTAWTLLSGRPPFGAADDQLARLTAAVPPPLLRADVPDAMESALRAALSPDPSRRPDLATLTQALRIVTVGAAPVADIAPRLADPAPEAVRALPSDPERQDTLAPTRPVEDAGRPLGSRYLLDALIGRGATGHVWRGHRRDDGRPVAVKLLRSELAEDPEVVTRFMRERASLMRLAHPNLVSVRDLVAEGEALAIVMDLVQGRDLRTELAAGPVALPDAARLLSQTAAALAAVHNAGMVHRDLKPENIIVEPAAGTTRARLTDFGLARAVESSVLTRATQLVGTPAYVAPEVVAGRSPGPPVDVYALGITAYEILAGRRPFVADSAAGLLRAHLDEQPARPEGLSDAVWALVSACLAKEPERRPSADDVAVAWQRVAAGEDPGPIAARTAAPADPADYAATPLRAVPREPDPVPDEQFTGSGRLDTTAAQRPLGIRHAAPAETHSRKKLWIALAAVVLLGFGGGFAWVALSKDDPAPKKAAADHKPYPLAVQVRADPKAGALLTWRVSPKVASDKTFVILYRIDKAGKLVPINETGFPPSQNKFYAGALVKGQCVVGLAYRPTVDPPKTARPKPSCLKSAPSTSRSSSK